MKKAILILAMVFACTLIQAQEFKFFMFNTTSVTAYNTENLVDNEKTPYYVEFVIKDGHYITNGKQYVALEADFVETTKKGVKMFEAEGTDWQDDYVYVLLNISEDPQAIGFFWAESYQVFEGEFQLLVPMSKEDLQE